MMIGDLYEIVQHSLVLMFAHWSVMREGSIGIEQRKN